MEPSFPLFRLPTELRLLVFQLHFHSITVRHGFRKCQPSSLVPSKEPEDLETLDTEPVRPHTSHIALLFTCKKIYEEARPLLAQNILLYCRTTSCMLDTLFQLGPELIRSLRYLRVAGYPFSVSKNGMESRTFTTYNFSVTLAMFPELQLDQLIVEDCYHSHDIITAINMLSDMANCWDLHLLLKTNGWKELHYISPSASFMDSLRIGEDVSGTVMCACQWGGFHRERGGGGNSGAEVNVYAVKHPDFDNLTEDPSRGSYTVHKYTNTKLELGEVPHEELGRSYKEIRVVARRAGKAPYVTGVEGPGEIQELLDRMGWDGMKKDGYYRALCEEYPDDCILTS